MSSHAAVSTFPSTRLEEFIHGSTEQVPHGRAHGFARRRAAIQAMNRPATDSLPCATGIGLRAPHYREVLESLPGLAWVEVHSENFFGGGAPLSTLLKVRAHYPVSLHGVGMGLASATPLDRNHLLSLRRLCDALQPAAVSEHLCWNAADGLLINDLLPFPYTEAALSHVAARVDQAQEILGRQLLVENLSSYLSFSHSEMTEGEFLAGLTRRTGCGILFDVENLYVNTQNLGVSAEAFIRAIPAEAVKEYHLAGYSMRDGCMVDTHDHPVYPAVWELYEYVLRHIGPRPTLIEWDADIPPLAVLMGEAAQAQLRMEQCHAGA
jgi:uncharacterized protein (UPF0276 family)